MPNAPTPSPAASARALLDVALRRHLEAGISLSDDVRHFMEATLGDDSVDTLRALLSAESSAEGDSLLDLIFFPEQTLQIALEPILERHSLGEEDIAALAEGLKRVPLSTHLKMPGTEVTLPVLMPAFVVDAFVARLNLSWQPAEALQAVLVKADACPLSPTGESRDGRMRLRVALRNAAIRQTPVQIRFLCDFFARRSFADPEFVDQLTFMLVFMHEHENSTNIYQALMARKKFLVRHLMMTRRSAAFAARNNMETLMMTGVRRPHFDVAAAQATLDLIDAIALAVFGRSERFDDAPRQVVLGDGAESMSPEELMKRLS
jgi:hypothetical protein